MCIYLRFSVFHMQRKLKFFFFFFLNTPPPTEIYPFPLPDPLPFLTFCSYCWGWAGVAGAALLPFELSCSRLFFSRFISTRPPLVRLALVVPALAAGTGALPRPSR